VACTFSKKVFVEDWYAVTLAAPVTIARVVYFHGKTFPDGGWFDTSAGKPRIEVKTTTAGDWEFVGELADYPDTSRGSAGLVGGEGFTCKLATPVQAVAIRLKGKPATGNNSKRAYSSCAELQAFDKP
jgi:hypothetical protein